MVEYRLIQGLSQDLETGCPKLAINFFWGGGHPIFQGWPQYTLITTINMYSLIEIMHNIHTKCRNYIEVENLRYMFEIDILINDS